MKSSIDNSAAVSVSRRNIRKSLRNKNERSFFKCCQIFNFPGCVKLSGIGKLEKRSARLLFKACHLLLAERPVRKDLGYIVQRLLIGQSQVAVSAKQLFN